jgi:HEAT repeat protein
VLLFTLTLAQPGPNGETAISRKSVLERLRDLGSGQPDVRKKAAYALQFLGDDGDRVLPALLRATHDRDSDVASTAIECITLIGPVESEGIFRRLVECSAEDNSTVRMAALTGLSYMGERSVPSIVKSLRHADPRTRAIAARSLRNLGSAAGAALPDLVIASRDVDRDARIAAVEALGTAGSVSARTAVPALLDALRDPLQFGPAVDSLAQIGKPAQIAIPALQLALEAHGWDTPEGEAVVRCLARLGAPPVLSLSGSLVREADIDAALLLAELGPSASVALPALVRALEDKRTMVRTLSALVIARVNPLDGRVFPVLCRAVESDDPDALPLIAAECLGRLGARAEPAVDSLFAELLGSKDPGLRAAAALALGQIGLPTPKVVSALATALKDDEPSVQESAADAIGLLGRGARSAVPAMVHLLKTPRRAKGEDEIDLPDPRVNALRALARMGKDAEPSVGTLIELLADQEREVAALSIDALAAIGPEHAARVLPHLLRIADSIPAQRPHAALALVGYGQQGRDVARRIADETDDNFTRAVLLSKLGLPSSEARAFTRYGVRSIELNLVLERPEFVLSAIDYVCHFGSNASAAIPILKNLRDHRDPAVRRAADTAIDKLSRKAQGAEIR